MLAQHTALCREGILQLAGCWLLKCPHCAHPSSPTASPHCAPTSSAPSRRGNPAGVDVPLLRQAVTRIAGAADTQVTGNMNMCWAEWVAVGRLGWLMEGGRGGGVQLLAEHGFRSNS